MAEIKIPKEVKFVIEKLKNRGFEAYIVGGCVRDLLRGTEPEDWDITTIAKPEEVGKIFLKSYTDNKFGTVRVVVQAQSAKRKAQSNSLKSKTNNHKNQKLEIMEIEVTTFRTEEKYTDKRHPDKIKWAETLEQDLKRRDFTVNAMALAFGEKSQIQNHKSQTNHKLKITNSKQFKIIDLFEGQKDLENKIIRAVGKPKERFNEDALRMLRAVRFAARLGRDWKIESETEQAIKKNVVWLQVISKERIRDEFMKIIMSEQAFEGIELLRKLGLLKYIIPELLEGYGVGQNKHHIYEVYEHNLLSLKYAVKRNFNKYVRLAALLHDVGKPRTKRGEGPDSTFYNHEVVGAKMTAQILTRLKFPKKEIEKIVKLVRYHLFYYNVDEVGEASVRRLVKNAGPENMEELLQLRYCDRIGSGVPKAEPYKLRHLKYIIEKISLDPISVKMLSVSGQDVMDILKIKPGPKIGQILDVLLGQVIKDPKNNKKEKLKEKIKELGKLSDKELSSLSQKARREREEIETKKDEMTKQKYWVT